MTARINEFVYLFLKLNVWLPIGSALMVAATALALSVPLSRIGVGLALPGLLVYFVYVEDRRTPSPEDHINQPYRTLLVEKYRTALLLTETAALVVYELMLVFLVRSAPELGVECLLLGQLPLAVLFAYDRLKRYPTFDSLSVGITWSFTVTFSVVVAATPPLSTDLLAVSVAWLLIVSAGVEARNVQDVEGDTETAKKTLAGHLGERRTRYLTVGLKASGVLVFWAVADPLTTGVVVLHLLLLQAFRTLTRRADAAALDVGVPGDLSRPRPRRIP